MEGRGPKMWIPILMFAFISIFAVARVTAPHQALSVEAQRRGNSSEWEETAIKMQENGLVGDQENL